MEDSSAGKSHLVLIVILSFLVLTIILLAATLVVNRQSKRSTSIEKLTPTPTSKNLFKEEANPFSEDTTYQNPFSSTQSGSSDYKNPFEQLR